MDDKEKQSKHITRIKSSSITSQISSMDFLSASKLEEGRVGNNPVELNLKKFIQTLFRDANHWSKTTKN